MRTHAVKHLRIVDLSRQRGWHHDRDLRPAGLNEPASCRAQERRLRSLHSSRRCQEIVPRGLAVLPVLPVFYVVASEGWRGLWSRYRAVPLFMTSTPGGRRRKVAIDAVCVAYLKARRPAQRG
jgi:hypothetical protein